MEYVLNELSLCGQYENGDQFATRGMTPLLGVLSTLSSFGVNDILKKSSIFDADVAKGLKLYELTNARMSPAVLAVCSHLSRMQREPFWDLQTVQEEGKCYYLQRKVDEDTIEEEDVSRTGVAEAYARKGCLISFCEDGYEENTEIIRREDEKKYPKTAITNLHDKEETEQFLFESGNIDYQGYVRNRYGKKLVYDELSDNHGLNLIGKSNFNEFFNSFRDFEDYSWQQIITSDGFDYKPFQKNRNTKAYFTLEQWAKGIHKFRISQEIRCFGYREGDKFHLLRIDLDHILSDKG